MNNSEFFKETNPSLILLKLDAYFNCILIITQASGEII